MKKIILSLIVVTLIVACAKRGRPTGGEKDVDPPKFMSSSPENNSINFNADEIKINFNEYIKLNDLKSQLVISPPMKLQPEITPLGTASKFIKIKIFDTLPKNTTISFDFGNAIEDNNEKNTLKNFKYVVSTGNEIDTLKLSGFVADALKREFKHKVSALLYEYNDDYNDSLTVTGNPYYATKVNDSTFKYEFSNLKPGKYQLVALEEENINYKFNASSDQIGFYSDVIELPTSDEFNLKIFKGKEYQIKSVKPKSNHKFSFEYLEKFDDYSVTNSDYPDNLITKHIHKDSLYFWSKSVKEIDTTFFIAKTEKTTDTFKIALPKTRKIDSLVIKNNSSKTTYYKDLNIYANNPLIAFNEQNVQVLKKDSSKVEFSALKDELTSSYNLKFKMVEDERYAVTLFPDAVEDYFGQKNTDTLKINVSTKKYASLGNAFISIKNKPKHNLIVQLVDANYNIDYEMIGRKDKYEFLNINPKKYFLRVIYDVNENGKYDSGDFSKRLQPEKVSYFPDELDIRANWDLEYEFVLK